IAVADGGRVWQHTSEINHTEEYKKHTGHKADESYTQNIRALFLLSSMNDGSPGPPSDERTRRYNVKRPKVSEESGKHREAAWAGDRNKKKGELQLRTHQPRITFLGIHSLEFTVHRGLGSEQVFESYWGRLRKWKIDEQIPDESQRAHWSDMRCVAQHARQEGERCQPQVSGIRSALCQQTGENVRAKMDCMRARVKDLREREKCEVEVKTAQTRKQ
ncbi:hypothetical protein JOQ06_002696, partial [Pogonophryne albipinna]